MLYFTALIVQLVVGYNILGPTEIIVGFYLLLRIAGIPEIDYRQEINRIIVVMVFAFSFRFVFILDARLPPRFTPLIIAIISFLAFIIVIGYMQSIISIIKQDPLTKTHKIVNQGLLVTTIALFIAIIAYNPFISGIPPIIALIGHAFLGIPYLYFSTAIDEFTTIKDVEADDMLYRQAK